MSVLGNTTPREIKKSSKLEHVCYDIRGPVLRAANEMEEAGHKIIKLNIGNPAPFGFEAPQEIINDVALNLPNAVGYTDSKGIFPARKAICQYYQQKGILDLHVKDVYIGNGVSELIVMAMQGLLDDGDEMLVPMPDYPLWTAAVNLSGGTAIHYKCDDQNYWYPDMADMESKITPNTRGYRSGWMAITGDKSRAMDYIEGLDMLASMRLCANHQAQYAIQTALGGYQSINDLIRPGGRLYEQRNIAWEMLNDIPGVSCLKKFYWFKEQVLTGLHLIISVWYSFLQKMNYVKQ
ncbi:unnamed protein product [Oppiella nova]|uniref:Aminotransferase class I/classII large domain-containing protein n=1 Tax=Oppiella nova TaxID=334625 RepID=A0A7R9L7H1_9ACAR|nr:unnamed protein product [Oppiella nova]CAG2157098.1 unnamed protein product [Oppiella nova]